MASVSGAVIYHPPPGVATGGGGKKSCRAKTIISARAKRALLSLSLFLSLFFFFFSFSSPSLRLATFLRFPALSSVPRGAGRREKRLSNPSSLGFQGLLLAAFNEKKDKTCPPPSFARIPCEIFRNWPRVSINKNRVFSSDFSRRRIQVRRSFFKF